MATTLAAAGVVIPGSPAHASTVVNVNVQTDAASGGCESSGTGPSCTLREAVIFANAHPGTTIMIPSGTYGLTVRGRDDDASAKGDLDLKVSTTIVGAGASTTIIDGGGVVLTNPDRVFDVVPTPSPGADVSISGVTIRDGDANDSNAGGGGILGRAGSRITVTDSVIATNTSFDGLGGGIASIGASGSTTSLTLLRTTLTGNLAKDPFSQRDARGGGAYTSASSLLVQSSTIDDNSAVGGQGSTGTHGGYIGGGGGLAVAADTVTASIIDSTLARNTAQGGDGISGASSTTGGSGEGGALEGTTLGHPVLVNTTVYANTAIGGAGAGSASNGGFGRGGAISADSVLLINSTVAANQVISGVAGAGGTAGAVYAGGISAISAEMTNSIVAGNLSGPPNAVTTPDDITGTGVHSGGHNIIGVAAGLLPSDQSGTVASPFDPKLASSLADNGGSPQTVALLTASPAINAGDNTVCAQPLPPAVAPNGAGGVDERGVARPQPSGVACDIGAFEYVFAPAVVMLTSTSNPALTASAVTLNANASPASGVTDPTGTVTFRDGSTVLGTLPLAGRTASITTSTLSDGAHAITATYSGDTVFAPSTGSLTQTVAEPGGATSGLEFYPLAHPVRLLDTRPNHAAFVQPGSPLTANTPIVLPGHVTIGAITIPAAAQALVGNATVDNTDGAPPGFATVWPSGSALPLASNLNFAPGTVRPNEFTVGLGSDGNFDLESSTGGHFLIDITGYYAPPTSAGLYFHPLARPVRLLDTRVGQAAVVHPGAALTAGQTLVLPGQFSAGAITVPASARALAGNATVDNTVGAPAGFATLFPGGADLPPTSNLNYGAGTVAPNAFTVGLGPDGSFDLFSNSGGDFVIDITGYYDNVSTGGLLYHALVRPARELDTRAGQSAAVQTGAPLAPGGMLNLPGAFTFDTVVVPATASAVVGNATVDNSINAPAGFATLYPGGTDPPLASNLNYIPGLVAPNAFIVGLGTIDSYNLFSQQGSNFIIDISGFFSPS
ncbi:MAG: polysaccharide deacetylase [Ilumatobacteraceae bacterium]|nr:polysaccharide deacetylase [Ilumatobacteraceae bacterium]